jgi:hypothetical protein
VINILLPLSHGGAPGATQSPAAWRPDSGLCEGKEEKGGTSELEDDNSSRVEVE